MSVSRPGSLPVLSYCALAALLGVGGCASTQGPNYASRNNVPPPSVVAQAVPATEDDGLPAQTPPPAYIRQLPDDPSEPFSRNYGGGNPAASVPARPENAAPSQPARVARIPLPEDLPPAFRHKLVTALSQDE